MCRTYFTYKLVGVGIFRWFNILLNNGRNFLLFDAVLLVLLLLLLLLLIVHEVILLSHRVVAVFVAGHLGGHVFDRLNCPVLCEGQP